MCHDASFGTRRGPGHRTPCRWAAAARPSSGDVGRPLRGPVPPDTTARRLAGQAVPAGARLPAPGRHLLRQAVQGRIGRRRRAPAGAVHRCRLHPAHLLLSRARAVRAGDRPGADAAFPAGRRHQGRGGGRRREAGGNGPGRGEADPGRRPSPVDRLGCPDGDRGQCGLARAGGRRRGSDHGGPGDRPDHRFGPARAEPGRGGPGEAGCRPRVRGSPHLCAPDARGNARRVPGRADRCRAGLAADPATPRGPGVLRAPGAGGRDPGRGRGVGGP